MVGISKATVDSCIKSAVETCNLFKTNFDKYQLLNQTSSLPEAG